MARSLTRALLALGVTATVTACGGGEKLNNNNTQTNNKAGALKVDSFTASAASVAQGGSVNLSWKVSGADSVSVTINRSPGAPVLEGATNLEGMVDSGAITEDTTFTLTVTGGGASITSSPVTVTVDAGAVEIVSFTASPNPATAGGTVTLAWDTAGATRIAIVEGTTELHSATTAQGTFQVTLTDTVHTYTLRAENDVMTASAMVTVTTETPPSITIFAVSPNTFTGASADVTVTFAAMGESFELTANGNPVSGYGGEAAGNLTVTVTEGTIFVFTARGAGQTETQMAAVAQAVGETEPNDDIMSATPITGGAVGTISSETDVDFYSFTVPAGGNVYAETSDGMAGCNFTSVIRLFNDTDTDPLVTAGFNGINGDCAVLDPAREPDAADLPAGTYYISVETFDMPGDYSLVVVVGNAACGNGITEGSASEQCDDGNTTAGDGCSDTCQIEIAGTVSGLDQDQTFSDSIDPASAADSYQVTLPSPGYIFAATGAPTLGVCPEPYDTVIHLLDAAFEEVAVADDTDEWLCSELTAADVFNRPLDAGTYWVRVTSYEGGQVIPNYQIQIRTVGIGCGNSVPEMGEQCDDGNTANGDGCSSTCTIETTGSISGTGGTQALTLGSDEDVPKFVTVTVTGGQSITATVTGPNAGPCPFETIIGLFDGAFTTQYGVKGGNGGCAFIDPATDTWATNLPAGPYLVAVATSSGAGGAVELGVTINDAVCGNNVLENNATEQCDDGNTSNGDGCDSMCQFEGNLTAEIEPNDTTANAQALSIAPGGSAQTISAGITPIGDIDMFSFTIASGTASLVANTYPTNGDPTSCNFDVDTLVELMDSTGTVIATNDDDPARSGFCSLLNSTTDPAAGMLAAGTYYVVVRHYDNTQSFPSYFVDISLTTP